jgi:hypothetical protein
MLVIKPATKRSLKQHTDRGLWSESWPDWAALDPETTVIYAEVDDHHILAIVFFPAYGGRGREDMLLLEGSLNYFLRGDRKELLDEMHTRLVALN